MTTTHPRDTIRTRPAPPSAPLVAALAFSLPFLAGLAGGGAIGDGAFPSPFAANAEILTVLLSRTRRGAGREGGGR